MKKPFNIWRLMTVVLLAFFVLFVVYPLITVLYQSVLEPGTNKLTLAYFDKFMARKYYWSTLVNSFSVTIVSTIFACVLGVPMAYVLRSVKVPGSKYLNILIVISYLSPPFIGAYAWVQLLGRNGFFTQLADLPAQRQQTTGKPLAVGVFLRTDADHHRQLAAPVRTQPQYLTGNLLQILMFLHADPASLCHCKHR